MLLLKRCFYFKLKNRFGPRADESKTVLDKFKTQVRFVVRLQYILGYELTKEWQYNNRTIFALIERSISLWLIVYSLYVERKSLQFIVLIAGLMLEVLVRFVINKREIVSIINVFIGRYKIHDDGILSPQILVIVGFRYEIVRNKLFRKQRVYPFENSRQNISPL